MKNISDITGGEVLIKCLYKEGIRVIFGLPGVQIYDAIIPILDYPNMKFITTRHEQATTYMADGFARASGKIGVSMIVPGPGLQNASAGITNAYASSSQVLVITGQINRDKISKNIGILHEINDQIDIIKPITKAQTRVLKAKDLPAAVKKSFFLLRTGRPRPVEIEIPPEALSEIAEPFEYTTTKITDETINTKHLEQAVEIILKSKNPVIWAGGGVHLSNSSNDLLALVEYLQIPVLTTPEGKGSISDKHYLSIGSPQGRSTGNSKDLLRDFFYTCDVVLAIGTRFANAEPKKNQKVIQIDIDTKEIGRNHKNTLGLVGNAKNIIPKLLKLIKLKNKPRDVKKTIFEKMKFERYDNPSNQVEPLSAYVKALRKAIPEDGILVTDMTTVAYYSRTHYHTYKPRSYFTSSYSGNLGSAFPTALGVKVAKPEKVVVSISGDGGFLFNVQELATAVQYKINTISVIFNDQSFGNVKRDMKKMFNNKGLGAYLINPNFIKLAESFGAVGMKAKNPKELEDLINQAISINKPVVIEVLVNDLPSPFEPGNSSA